MQIIKRDGTLQEYSSEKIKNAIKKVFACQGKICPQDDLDEIIFDIEKAIVKKQDKNEPITVEWIQDCVEIALMKKEYFKEVRSYIVYRDEHAKTREAINNIAELLRNKKIIPVLKKIQKDFKEDNYDLSILESKLRSELKDDISADYALDLLIASAASLISKEASDYKYIAARLLSFKINQECDRNMARLNITNFYEKLVYLTSISLYGPYILEAYTRSEIEELGKYLVNSRNELFTYTALNLIYDKYLLQSPEQGILEKPQEMFMGIAMHIASKEKDKLLWAKEIYDLLSKQKLALSSTIISSARTVKPQLASSFCDVCPDDLLGIYKTLDSFSEISKYDGGMGIYFGKVRSCGSNISTFKGLASGVVKWAKLVNDTVIAVERFGRRKGACTIYLDVWHKDFPEFLQITSNSSLKCKDIRLGACFPDLFWEIASKNINENWYMMDPHEIFEIKGYNIEDSYGQKWLDRYYDCLRDDRIIKRVIPIKEMIRMIIKCIIDTSSPLIFNRDVVNITNPNNHTGMIYCSNLCGELLQNTSCSNLFEKEIIRQEEGDIVIEKTRAGQMPSLVQASLNLGNINVDDNKELKHIIDVSVTALDDLIDLNTYPVPYAKIFADDYRSLGLGVLGYNHLLVKKGIDIESDEHLNFADDLFERINYFVLNASCNLAKNKGSYKYYKGSAYDTGEYFNIRFYNDDKWEKLKQKINKYGLRNGYLLAIAPTNTSAIMASTTKSIEPIGFRYSKENGIFQIAPDLNLKTFWLYKEAHYINQNWLVKANSIRQRHIDQGQATNLYITSDYNYKQVLDLLILSWNLGVKTICSIQGS